MTTPPHPAPGEVPPEYIKLGRQLLKRIDGADREVAAMIIGGSIAMTVDAQLKAIMEELIPVESYVQNIENRVPIGIVCGVVRACSQAGHPKYPKSCL